MMKHSVAGDAFRTINPAAACVAGMQAAEAGNTTKAIAHFERALELAPSIIDVRLLLVFALASDGQKTLAGTVLGETPEIDTLPGSDLRRIADAATQVGAYAVALKAVRVVAVNSANDADVQATLGSLLHKTGAIGDASHVLQRAVLRWPKHVPALLNYARLLVADGAYLAALGHYDRAIRIAPRNNSARWNRGMLRLMLGDHAGGWSDCEARRALPVHTVNMPQNMPAWDGRNASGKTLLLWGEQGLGDQIQGVRFASALSALGARIVVRCSPALQQLFSSVAGVSETIIDGEVPANCDAHVPMLSVPHLLNFTSDEQYRSVSYIRLARSTDTLRLSERRGHRQSHDSVTRAGIVWAGSPGHVNDAFRSLPLAALEPLLADVAVTWFSLQKGDRERDLQQLPAATRRRCVNVAPHLTDFVDTAHVLNELDRVVTVDTAVAHLAGAMGIPTLLLTPFVPDWRWQLARDDTPWYESVRVLRQCSRGDWNGVISRVHRELAAGGQARAA